MVNVCFLPSDPSRCCLDIPSLLSSLEAYFSWSTTLNIQQAVDETTEALFWLPSIGQGDTSSELGRILSGKGRNVGFVQLPMTGVDHFVDLIRQTQRNVRWFCAKGCYAELVAEHALALALTLVRCLHTTPPRSAGCMDTLYRKRVLIVGAGYIGRTIHRLLHPFGCIITLLDSSCTPTSLLAHLSAAELIFLACPLTPTTRGLLSEQAFAHLHPTAILVNVARGELVHTPALLSALEQNNFKAAGLDVISFSACNKEQQNKLHHLVQAGKLLVSPHSAVPTKLIGSLLGQRIRHNLERLVNSGLDGDAGWAGLVDPNKGY